MNTRRSGDIQLRKGERADLICIAEWLGPDGDEFAGSIGGFAGALVKERLYVGLEGGSPVAALFLIFDDEDVEPIIVVDPSVRGRHLGRAVLNAVVELPAVADCKRITAAVRAENLPALRMLEGLGYARTQEADPSDRESHHGYELALARRR